jgi:hypothetical protein
MNFGGKGEVIFLCIFNFLWGANRLNDGGTIAEEKEIR